MKIAVLADLHYGAPCVLPERRAEIADLLLMRTGYRLNRLHRPDVTLVLGDLLDNGQAADAHQRLAQLRAMLDKLDSPSIVIPGNHDGDIGEFCVEFERPKEVVEIGGVRFLPFLDPEEPGCNASRGQRDIDRFRLASPATSWPCSTSAWPRPSWRIASAPWSSQPHHRRRRETRYETAFEGV